MQGTRLPDREFSKRLADPRAERIQRGDYGRVSRQDVGWVWMCCTPSGHVSDLTAHEVTEHEDGTITVAPSIVVEGGQTVRERGEEPIVSWHGFLKRGVWHCREAP